MSNKHEQPPQVAEKKKPRLFYYDDDVNAWVPLWAETENAVLAEFTLDDGDVIKLALRRHDMTDAEFEAIP
ncbi:MAG: hypothetical protein GY794_16190 [bacterium]|nr:hypothetical protein [bacterium]